MFAARADDDREQRGERRRIRLRAGKNVAAIEYPLTRGAVELDECGRQVDATRVAEVDGDDRLPLEASNLIERVCDRRVRVELRLEDACELMRRHGDDRGRRVNVDVANAQSHVARVDFNDRR